MSETKKRTRRYTVADYRARACGVRWATVNGFLMRRGLTPNASTPTSKYARALEQCANEGLTTSEAAKRIGISTSYVWHICKRIGIELRPSRKP